MIKALVKYILDRGNRKLLKHFAILNPTCINRVIKIRLDNPEQRIYLNVGANSIVSGTFVFESGGG